MQKNTPDDPLRTFGEETDRDVQRILLTLNQDGTESQKRHRISVLLAGLTAQLVESEVISQRDLEEMLADCIK